MMTSAQVRQAFLDFFARHGHTIVPSSSLLPSSPNLLFTNSGMNQFVPIFLGEVKPPYPRAADTQKSIRAGGKHNDLEAVGRSRRHHTFFEMLGNWSFGDYFKEGAITMSWELITKVFKLDPTRIHVTCYAGDPGAGIPKDTEAADIWRRVANWEQYGLKSEHHIHFLRDENFWEMGNTGPCGPCTEIFIDNTPDKTGGPAVVSGDDPRVIEFWNNVFIQYNRDAEGNLTPLPMQHVDTGMGFERMCYILQGKSDNYATDVFSPIFDKIAQLSGKTYTGLFPPTHQVDAAYEAAHPQLQVDIAFRVVADHIRTVSAAIADGILPSNEGRNYVIRRILRRAVLYSKKLGLQIGDFSRLSATVVETLGGVFPELKAQQEIIRKVILAEEEQFGRTLARGLKVFEERTAGSQTLSGADAFELYDTYGFPLDLTEVLAAERGLTVDKKGFEVAMEGQKNLSRASQKTTDIVVQSGNALKTTFVGYDDKHLTDHKTTVLASAAGKYVVTASSPFYAEMGGQVGDTGTLVYNGRTVAITDTRTDPSGTQLHVIKDSIEIPVGATVTLSVDTVRRSNIERHHSATHLLDWALRTTLGGHIKQAGSLVTADRLRFDFSHFSAVESADLRTIERAINEKIIQNQPVRAYQVPYKDKPADVVAVFGEKYGEVVRVVDIGGYSRELCGGTHVAATGQIGYFRLIGESAIAAGTRRIEAVVGPAAIALLQDEAAALRSASLSLGCRTEELPTKIEQLKENSSNLEKKIKELRTQQLHAIKADLIAGATQRDGLPLIKAVVADCDGNDLKTLAQLILGEIKEGIVILGSATGGKANVVAAGSRAAVSAGFNAGTVIGTLTQALDGKGGGRPEMAQGSGKAIEKLPAAIAAI